MLSAAALTGLAASMRTFAPLGAQALTGGVSGRARTVGLALAGGELVYDKTPWALSRVRAPSWTARTVSGAVGGGMLAGPRGALVGGAVACAGTHLTYHFRARLCPAAVEDVLAYGLALAATRRPPS